MSHFRPYEGLHVYMMSKREAERYTRHVYNVPKDVGLGWTPYTILIQSYGATSYCAFYSARDMRKWLGDRYTVSLNRKGWQQRRAFRSGLIVQRKEQPPCPA